MARRLFSSLPTVLTGSITPSDTPPPAYIEINIRSASQDQAQEIASTLGARLVEIAPSAAVSVEYTRTVTSHGIDAVSRQYEVQTCFIAPGPFRADR